MMGKIEMTQVLEEGARRAMRLIDADALIKVIMSSTSYNSYEWAMYADDIIETYIDLAPTIDAVEVVRCKDCQHKVVEKFGARSVIFCIAFSPTSYVKKPDDFCSYGERGNQ